MVAIAELPGVESETLNVAGQGRTLTDKRRTPAGDPGRFHRLSSARTSLR